MNMANQFLSLSLFIMLLSFFIILNTMSNYEEVKSRPVLNSLAQAFSSEVPEQVLAPATIQSPEQSMKEGDTINQLQTLFNAHITGVEMNTNRLGTELYVRMRVEDFELSLMAPATSSPFNTGTPSLGDPGSFMPTLISLMQSAELKIPYRMDLILNTADKPAILMSDSPEQLRLNRQKASLLTKKLQESGLPKKMMSAGLESGEEGFIDIYFKPYESLNLIIPDAGGNDNV